ncbi:hypothetical protein [Flavobacterium rhizosphaerae]|uniref:Uncharacterized protein n=1 Tax=Flavobacterium rhizosphaerae TaxID=3163298 RepID=A0ABW8YSS2_9FLAO
MLRITLDTTLEIIGLIISCVTPLLVFIFGVAINKKIENSKLSALKEKEWQVKWAETFLKHATDFNDNISLVISNFYYLQMQSDKNKKDEILNDIEIIKFKVSVIDWNIRNYTQFAENGNDVIKIQSTLISQIDDIFKGFKGDLEVVRNYQSNYNKAVRKAHNSILNSK